MNIPRCIKKSITVQEYCHWVGISIHLLKLPRMLGKAGTCLQAAMKKSAALAAGSRESEGCIFETILFRNTYGQLFLIYKNLKNYVNRNS